MTTSIADLQAKIATLRAELRDMERTSDILQEVCQHQWADEGYDPRGSGTQYYKCRKCGLERTE